MTQEQKPADAEAARRELLKKFVDQLYRNYCEVDGPARKYIELVVKV